MILGIDTSCYTTSLALVNQEGRLLCDFRRPLSVPTGERGLRQSDGVFAHVRNLPELMEELFAHEGVGKTQVKAIAVSGKPRPVDGSYMPVFQAGLSLARSLGSVLQVPVRVFSHQEGHIQAALWSINANFDEPFIACHLSGGTGEVLLVQPNSQNGGYTVDVLGSADLPPGQFVDRIAQAMDLPFPGGIHLDTLADLVIEKNFRLPRSVKEADMSFSGPCSAAVRGIKQGVAKGEIAAAVFDCIGKSLHKAIDNARRISGIRQVLLMGGVASSRNLRNFLARDDVLFGEAKMCGDNAVGIALLGRN